MKLLIITVTYHTPQIRVNDIVMHVTLNTINDALHLLWYYRVTPYMRLKACDHCILRSLIGWKGQDCPSSLHTRKCGPLRAQRNYHGWKVYMNSYMVDQVSYTIGATFGWETKVFTNTWSPPLASVWSGTYIALEHFPNAVATLPLNKFNETIISCCLYIGGSSAPFKVFSVTCLIASLTLFWGIC